MSEAENKLNELSSFFRRISAKVKLINLIERAKIEYDKCNLDFSLENLEKAYQLDSQNATILRGLGCVNQALGNIDKAIEYYKKAVEVSTKKEVEYSLLGAIYYLQDNLDEAVKYFNLAIEANDNYDVAYEGRNQAMLENHLKVIDLQEALNASSQFLNH